jgi:putative effector of murein hydrolase
MEKKKTLNFSMAIIAFILAFAIYKQYDFEKREFEKISLVILYSVTLAVSMYILLNDYFKKPTE